MKTRLIITGEHSSGKTYTAEIMSKLLPFEKVIWIDGWASTLKKIKREIKKKEYQLVVIEEVENINRIIEIESILNSPEDEFSQINVIYTTQKNIIKAPDRFKILKCNFTGLQPKVEKNNMKIKPNPTLPPFYKKVLFKCVGYHPNDYDREDPINYTEPFLGHRVPGDRGGYYYIIPGLPQKRDDYDVVEWQEVPEF